MPERKKRMERSKLRLYLAQAREKKGLSMRKLAREAGMSYQHYAMMEYGERGNRISFMIMSRISDALDLSMDFIKENEKRYQEEVNNYDY